MRFNVGDIVLWDSRIGTVEAEYRGRVYGAYGWEAVVICRPKDGPPYQTSCPERELRSPDTTQVAHYPERPR